MTEMAVVKTEEQERQSGIFRSKLDPTVKTAPFYDTDNITSITFVCSGEQIDLAMTKLASVVNDLDKQYGVDGFLAEGCAVLTITPNRYVVYAIPRMSVGNDLAKIQADLFEAGFGDGCRVGSFKLQ